jgi:hypothetical protein
VLRICYANFVDLTRFLHLLEGLLETFDPHRCGLNKTAALAIRRDNLRGGEVLRAELPAALGDAWKLTAVCHVAEANTGYTELGENTAWAAIDGVTAAYANWRSVAWKLL